MDELNLPRDFIKNVHNAFDEEGVQFIANLPKLIEEARQRWELSDIRPVPNLSYNFVAFAKRGEEEIMLKIGVPDPELVSEMTALKLFKGDGSCRLLDCDENRGFLLLERLNPGTMLSELADDDQRTHIAMDVMQKTILSRGEVTSPLLNKFIKLTTWFDALKKIRPLFNGGTGPFPKKILEHVESFLSDAWDDHAQSPHLLHGDFHHFNILLSERGWLVIDPKGVIGPAGYEIGPLMINPWNSISDRSSFKAQTERRVSIISERLGWEREFIINWATAHAVLSSWWDLQPDGTGGEYSLRCAEIFSEIK
ncbi:MAG: phosphotransferase [Chloroflexi bacterium]|nr:phosphotransferase [Chloroflexota bacterium]